MSLALAVFFDGYERANPKPTKELLVCIEMDGFRPVNEILDRYAQQYAFERNRLSGIWVDVISKEEFGREK